MDEINKYNNDISITEIMSYMLMDLFTKKEGTFPYQFVQ